jgi:hypothetical protein
MAMTIQRHQVADEAVIARAASVVIVMTAGDEAVIEMVDHEAVIAEIDQLVAIVMIDQHVAIVMIDQHVARAPMPRLCHLMTNSMNNCVQNLATSARATIAAVVIDNEYHPPRRVPFST